MPKSVQPARLTKEHATQVDKFLYEKGITWSDHAEMRMLYHPITFQSHAQKTALKNFNHMHRKLC
jgi:hypothetical protein